MGIAPGGTHRNLSGVGQRVEWHVSVPEGKKILLCDAQTSGGLLMSVSPENTENLLGELEALGVKGASVVGEVLAEGKGAVEVSP